jgi:hypothetical protein
LHRQHLFGSSQTRSGLLRLRFGAAKMQDVFHASRGRWPLGRLQLRAHDLGESDSIGMHGGHAH